MRNKTISLVLSVCSAQALYAADLQDVKLQQIAVEGSYSYGSDSEIIMKTIEKTQAKDIADVFSKESSISVGGGALNAQRIYLRGIESSNINITIDGARQGTNLHQHRGNVMGIDPDLLKMVNVSTAPNAQNGAGALGGSISMTTKDAQDFRISKESVGAIVNTSYSSVSESQRGGTTIYGVYDNHFGAYAHISAENRGNYTQGGGDEALATAYRNRAYFAKFSLLDHENNSLRLSIEKNENKGSAKSGSHGSDMGPYIGDESDLSMQVSTREAFALEHQYNPNNDWINLTTNLYKNDISLDNLTSDSQTSNEDIGGTIKNKTLLSLGETNSIFVLGVDYFSQDGISKYSNDSEIKNNSNNLGFFMQNTTSLYGLDIHYGGRYDNYEVEFGPRTFSGKEFSPNVGLEFSFNNKLSIYANYGETIRATGLIPVGWISNIGETTNFNDGKAFKPESSIQKEAGVKYKHKNLFAQNDQFALNANYFLTTMKDSIERVGGGKSNTPQGDVSKIWNNPEEIETKGYELKLSWQNPIAYIGVSYTHIDTSSDTKELDVVRRKAAKVGDTLVLNSDYKISSELTLGYIFKAVKGLNNTTIPRPGYATHDLQMSFEPSTIKNLKFSLAVNNITDKKYALQSSMYSSTNGVLYEPGRDVRVGLRYQF